MRNIEKHSRRRLLGVALTAVVAVLASGSVLAALSLARQPAPAKAAKSDPTLERSAPRKAAVVASRKGPAAPEPATRVVAASAPVLAAIAEPTVPEGASAANELALLRERAPGERWELEQRTRAVAHLAQVLAATPSALTEGERAELERRHWRLEEKLRDQEESVKRMEERIAALTKVGAERVDAPRTAEGAER